MAASYCFPRTGQANKRSWIGYTTNNDGTNWTRMSPQPDEQVCGRPTRPHSEELRCIA